jgi:hypothetical protein
LFPEKRFFFLVHFVLWLAISKVQSHRVILVSKWNFLLCFIYYLFIKCLTYVQQGKFKPLHASKRWNNQWSVTMFNLVNRPNKHKTNWHLTDYTVTDRVQRSCYRRTLTGIGPWICGWAQHIL